MLVVYDICAINLASLLALMLRFDFFISSIPKEYWMMFVKYIPVNTLLTLIIFYINRMYHSLWIYASINEAWNAMCGVLEAALAEFWIMFLIGSRMPISYYPLSAMLLFMFVIGARVSYRLARFFKYESRAASNRKGRKNVMVIGAGDMGKTIVDEIHDSNHLDYNVKCLIDDGANKKGRYISGVLVAGGRDTIIANVERYSIDIIMIAIPSMTAESRKDILSICQNTGCEVRILPAIYKLVNGNLAVNQMRKVNIMDLLGRDQREISVADICEFIKDKVVLVTGGGGSIGSELCRQIASYNPGQLIIFDIYENNAYEIEQELKVTHPDLNLVTLIGSVRNEHRINEVFETYKPDVVYHAAAHKHVPLMEKSPNEAIKNNVFGTWNTAKAAIKYGTERFVLISTDKAVNPTNIMGASKRLCEMIVQMMNGEGKTLFSAVRFGNVLGSNGSVIPLFEKQIERGGPVTVTHPDIVRFFMTIREAVSLILEAGVYARGGEIFVLDMGDPVKIDELARKMIRLSGYIPDEDIKVEYTGLRPGEKLYEEILMNEEGIKKTENDRIYIGKPIEFNKDEFAADLAELKELCMQDDDDIKEKVSKMVSTYKVYKGE